MDFRIYNSIEEVGEEEWDRYVHKRFFLSYNYLRTLELACTQLSYRYVIVYDQDRFVGIFYFQIIPFYGESLRQYLPSTNGLFHRFYNLTLAKVKTNLLVLGNIIFTCENGVLLTENYNQVAESLVYEVTNRTVKSMSHHPLGTMISENIKSVSNKLFCPKQYHVFQVEDRMELNLKSFKNFENYTYALQSKYRVRLNKVLELNKRTEVIALTKDNFLDYRTEIESLFLNVLNRSKFKLTTISVDYFYQFLLNLDRFRMKGYLYDNKLIGFVSYFQLDTIIEVHYAGIDYEYNQSHRIYNYMLIDMVRTTLDSGLSRTCFGRTAQELKSTLGALPFSTLSSLKINNNFLNIFTPLFLSRMLPETWTLRTPFKTIN